MIEQLYKKDNNIFQSSEWENFHQNFGHKTIKFGPNFGIKLDLPLAQKFIWIQKGPEKIRTNELIKNAKEAGVVFVRLEPKTAVAHGLRPVTKNSMLSGQASPKATRVLVINKTEEKLLAEMKPKTRYNIRLAEKRGVKVRVVEETNDLYKLLKETAAKDKGYAPHEEKYYQKMLDELGKNQLVKIFLAEYEGEPLAAILVTFYGEVATYLHGGSSQKRKELMAPYLCQWEAIKYAKSRGCKLYDFWGISENEDIGDSWAGITKFKKGFGGEKVIFPGTFDIVLKPFWYTIFTLAAKLKRVIK